MISFSNETLKLVSEARLMRAHDNLIDENKRLRRILAVARLVNKQFTTHDMCMALLEWDKYERQHLPDISKLTLYR